MAKPTTTWWFRWSRKSSQYIWLDKLRLARRESKSKFTTQLKDLILQRTRGSWRSVVHILLHILNGLAHQVEGASHHD